MWLGLILRIVSEEKDCYMPVIGGCGALNLLLWCLKRSARLSSVNRLRQGPSQATATFQAFLDYLVRTQRSTEKTLIMLFICYTKSAPTLESECVVWHKAARPCFHWKYCPVSVYRCWGKRHLLFGVGFKQWGRFHELYSVVSLALGTPLWVPGCKLWMIYEVFLWAWE